MKIFQIMLLVLVSILSSACVYEIPRKAKPAPMVDTGLPDYRRHDLGEMASYSGYIGGLSGHERLAECKKLLSGDVGDPNSTSLQLHAAWIMMLTPECGGPEKAVLILGPLRDRDLPSDLKNLVRYQVSFAYRMIAVAEQRQNLQTRINDLEVKEAALQKRLKENDNELSQLKATLEALKKIEKSFHQRNESGIP